MEDIEKFIRDRACITSRNTSNCVGTALYLVGETDNEEYISRKNSRKILNNMKISIKPELGYVASWESDGTPIHAGVIYMENPFYVVYKDKEINHLVRVSLEDFNALWTKKTNLKPIYRIPNKLFDNLK